MRRLYLLVALLALPAASAGEAYVVLLDWREGHSLAGTTTLAISPLADRFGFDATPCHRALLLDLLYTPEELLAGVDGVGEVALSYEFLTEVWRGDERVSSVRVREPRYGIPLGTTDAAGPHELRLSLANGADVEWDVRVRGRELPDEPACWPQIRINEIEANPPGVDAGNEWLELYNADAEAHELGGWVIVATHNATVSVTLPAGLRLDPGARALVAFKDGQTLDNYEEVVELRDGLGRLIDVTPALTDGENDARTWQRSPDGADAWVFATATPP